MEDNNNTKISISTFLLILSIIVIIIMVVYIYVLNNDKTEQIKNSEELQNQVNNQSTSNSSNSIKELSDVEKQELFNKVIKEQTTLIDDMVSIKDFSEKDFSDKEIILLLPDSSAGKIFSSYEDDQGFYSKASISDVEKSAKELFDKTINVTSAQNNDSIRIIDDNVVVEVRSGVGVLNSEFISIDAVNANEYAIKFRFSSGSGITDTYILTVSYVDGNIIYKSFEK